MELRKDYVRVCGLALGVQGQAEGLGPTARFRVQGFRV